MPAKEKHSNPSSAKRETRFSDSRLLHLNPKSKQEYVDYVLRMAFHPEISEMVIDHEDRSKYPVVLTDAHVPGTALTSAELAVKGVVYTFPKDFDYGYTFHTEINEVTGSGYDMIKETLRFKNLVGHPTILGRTELKSTGCIFSPKPDYSHAEVFGNFQVTGTGIFKDVEGSGIAMFGASTGYVVYHIAWIKGWPL